MSDRSMFRTNLRWQYVLQFLKYVLPLITLPYLTRVLEPSAYAVVAYVAALMAYVQVIVDFGFNLSGTKRIAVATCRNDECRTLTDITVARLLLSVLVFLGVVIFASNIQLTRDNLVYTMVSFVAVCGRTLTPDFIFQGKETMKPLTTRYLITKGTSTLLVFVLIDSPSDLLWVPCIDILASVISVSWSLLVIRSMFGVVFLRPSMRGALKELRDSAVYCFSNVAATSLSAFITLMIGISLTTDTEVAYWSLAITAVSAVQALNGPIVNSLYPHIVVTRDYQFIKRIALRSLPVVLLLSVVFFLSSDLIFLILGGWQYRDGAFVARLLSPLVCLAFYATLLGWPLLGAAGRVRPLTGSTIAAAAFCIMAFGVMYFVGITSIVSLCVLRVCTELVLLATRLSFGWRFLRPEV